MSRPEDVNELLKWREARPNRYKLRDKIESREDFRAKYSKALEAKGLKNDKNISQEISKRRLNLKLDDQLKYDKQESQAGKTLLELTREKQYLSQQHGVESWTSALEFTVSYMSAWGIKLNHIMNMQTRLTMDDQRLTEKFENRIFLPHEQQWLKYISQRYKPGVKPPLIEPVLQAAHVELSQRLINLLALNRITFDTWVKEYLEVSPDIQQDIDMLRRGEHEISTLLHRMKTLLSASTLENRLAVLSEIARRPVENKDWKEFGNARFYAKGDHPDDPKFMWKQQFSFGKTLLEPQADSKPQYSDILKRKEKHDTPPRQQNFPQQQRRGNYGRGQYRGRGGYRGYQRRGRGYRGRGRGSSNYQNQGRYRPYTNSFRPQRGRTPTKRSGLFCYNAAESGGKCFRRNCHYCSLDREAGNKFIQASPSISAQTGQQHT